LNAIECLIAFEIYELRSTLKTNVFVKI